MKLRLLVFLLVPTIFIAVKITVYRSGWLVVGRFLENGTPVDLGLPISYELVNVEVPQPTLTLLERGNGDCSIIAIHGLDPQEYEEKSLYMEKFTDALTEAWKKSKSNCNLYFYRYPSFFESYWDSGKRLVRLSKDLKRITIIAHSKGGLVARCALEDPSFRKKVHDVYFLGTPHLGTPMANALKIDPTRFEEYFDVDRTVADVLRLSLAMSYTAGYIASVGSKELSWKNESLPPLRNYPGVRFHFVAGMIGASEMEDMWRAFQVSMERRTIVSGGALIYLAIIGSLVEKKYPVTKAMDGLVPVESALAYGKLKGEKLLLYGYNHAALFMDVDLLEKMISGSDLLPPVVEAMGFEPTTSTLRR